MWSGRRVCKVGTGGVCVGVGEGVKGRVEACLVRSRGDPEGQSGDTETLLRDTKPIGQNRDPSCLLLLCNAAAVCGERGLEGRGRRSERGED
jgi:hypothetical protein